MRAAGLFALVLIALGLALTPAALAQSGNEAGRLYKQASKLYKEGKYAEAEPLYKRALAIGEKVLGPEHPNIAAALTSLAALYDAQGRYAEAEPLHKRALAIYEKALGPARPNVATVLNNLGALYKKQGRAAEAEPLYKRALAIREKTLGPEHPRVARGLYELAELYNLQGRYSEAEPLYERALAIREKTLGPEHPRVARGLHDLAELYATQGRYSEAEPLYKRALTIDEKALGPEHSNVGGILSRLGSLYVTQGRYSEAEPLFKRALAIGEKVLGPEHTNTAAALANLAGLYDAQGRYAEAEPLHKRALAIREKALGPENPLVATGLNDLAKLYENQGRYAEAEPLHKRALAVYEKALGPEDSNVATALNNLAALYYFQGRYSEAEPLYKRALAIGEKVLGPEHPDVAFSLNNLAQLYKVQGRYAEAAPLFERARTIDEKALGTENPYFATDLNNLAGLYDAQGRYSEAEPLFKRALAIYEKALGPAHPRVALALNNLAHLYFAQQEWAVATDYWRGAARVIERRVTSGTASASNLAGQRKSEAERYDRYFRDLVKAAYRLAEKGSPQRRQLANEMFETAQWAESSQAAQSLAQMAARTAKGSRALAMLVRERQDLVAEWQTKDKQLIASKSKPPEKRKTDLEKALADRIAAIDARIRKIDTRLASEFPDYAALASPKPVSVTDVQAVLHDNEALVMFLDTAEEKPAPAETFIWVVTKTDSRWVRSSLGGYELQDGVAILRCGLDREGAWQWSGKKKRWVGRAPACVSLRRDGLTSAESLPFDLAGAHELYKDLFGKVEDLIKDKHLLLVPTGALTSLPFQVLVTKPPEGVVSGKQMREVARLGAELAPFKKGNDSGVTIARPLSGGAAETAGLKSNDILLAVGDTVVTSVPHAVAAVRAQAPRTSVKVRVQRDGKQMDVPVVLGAITVAKWVPHFLTDTSGPVEWLIRRHALTVLPSVASLTTLRRNARGSAASKPFIGFGNPQPLRSCGADVLPDTCRQDGSDVVAERVARSARGSTGIASEYFRGGLADVGALRSRLCALPETAYELRCVAKSLGVSSKRLVLGKAMTETAVKKMSLSRYRVVHFATHGLLAGETAQLAANLSEPSLVFAPPDKASEEDDGLLTASEVAGLKLDADWVIMSACNTAAGGKPGAEALSGLAKAFFYAGARALLVSHWSVYSEAAVKLITQAMSRMAADKRIGRAEAMRQSMLALIDRGASEEAHPAFWAPFVVVGEGAARLQ